MPKPEQVQALAEIVSNVRRIALEKMGNPIAGRPFTGTDQVLLVFPSELTAGNK